MILKPTTNHRKSAEVSESSARLAEARQSFTLTHTQTSVEMGWGRCSISGCPCAAYQQTYGSELCNNCGHKYTDHW